MLRIAALLLLLAPSSPDADLDEFNYCQLENKPNCRQGAHPDRGGHAACKCSTLAGRKEVPGDDPKAFRQEMLDLHNFKRNYVASGKQTGLPPAADMMVLNWDSELEYIAKCRLLNSFGDGSTHEPCTYISDGKHYGQNIYSSSGYDDSMKSVKDSFELWYEEVSDVLEETIGNYGSTGTIIRHFTQIVWASTTHIGCVRVYNEQAETYKLRIFCNYKSEFGSFGGNVVGKAVYKRGRSCSACPGDTRCQTSKYPALCGQLMGVPGSGISGRPWEGMILLVSLYVLF